jgi:hypothetical protein
MKKRILGLSILLYGCTYTYSYKANTDVTCPCVIKSLKVTNGGYYIKAYSLEKDLYYFGFYTNHLYNIGDTIK